MIIDRDLGEIKLIKNARAKRITVRFRDGQYQLTHPSFVSLDYIQKTVSEMKPKLLKLKETKPARHTFSPQTELKTFSFILKIVEGASTTSFYAGLKNSVLSISCPADCDYQDVKVQNYIRSIVENAFRYEAKRLFPEKVSLLARKHRFNFTDVKINKSRTRWGSCSSKKSINLSYYCMLLPEYLIDFVILHELCHTVEMNHGDRFWQLLDCVSDGKAISFTQELKTFRTYW